MRVGAFYKHRKMTDVCILPIKAFFIKEKKIFKLKVHWHNLSSQRIGASEGPEPMNIIENVKITKEELKDWLYHE